MAGISDVVEQFSRDGFLPAMQVLDQEALAHFRAFSLADKKVDQSNQNKTLWMIDASTRKIAGDPRIKAILDALLGERGYYLWGAQLIDRAPAGFHAWHTDIETAREGFVSLWIGIEGVNIDSALQAIPGSHLMGEPVQATWQPADHPARRDADATEILDHINRKLGAARLVRVDCGDGDGIFFDGRLWHGTFNRLETPRRALLLQYGRHGAPVRRAWNPDGYPFEYDPALTPVVLPLRGDPDPISNKNVEIDANGELRLPGASIAAAPRLEAAEGQAWTTHPYFQTKTPIMEFISCHASVLRGGFMPHMPHNHGDEELLVVLSGKAVIMSQYDDTGVLRAFAAQPGDFIYYPRGHAHTILNGVDDPNAGGLIYLMLKWRTSCRTRPDAKPFFVRQQDYGSDPAKFAYDFPASGLEKLHIHATRLAPGDGNPRHIDRYDTAIVVLSGALTVLDKTLTPGGAFLIRAGELHDTVNKGEAPCEYLVFEFHSMLF